jgi:hypothetical protein
MSATNSATAPTGRSTARCPRKHRHLPLMCLYWCGVVASRPTETANPLLPVLPRREGDGPDRRGGLPQRHRQMRDLPEAIAPRVSTDPHQVAPFAERA